jgi:hypothetical protein
MLVIIIQITATLYTLTSYFNAYAVLSQRIISTQPAELYNLCPGQEVTITCEIRGSPIIAWSSDEYIGRGAQLHFISIDPVGVIRRINSTVATLINSTNDNGVTILVSQLRIIGSLSSSVACMNHVNGMIIAIMVHVLGMFNLTFHLLMQIRNRYCIAGVYYEAHDP